MVRRACGNPRHAQTVGALEIRGHAEQHKCIIQGETPRGAARGSVVHTLYCVYVTSRRLNLHAARERAMKYSRRRHGRHATCARTMHRTGFGCCCVPFFDLPPFSPRGEKKRTNFDFIMYRECTRVTFVLLENKGNYMELLRFYMKMKKKRITRINSTNRYNMMNVRCVDEIGW